MKTSGKIAATQKFCQRAPKPLVFVPTMGALHEGHASLIRKAKILAGKKGTVAVSIFVNPTQFGPKEDFSKYPRAVQADNALCRSLGVNLLFRPASEEMYFKSPSIQVQEGKLSTVLCGASRPGHFNGVCTVVTKLFHIVQPDIAIFGEKDWQQLAIIRRMVRDLNFPIQIIGGAIVRESDGLAMSSRNHYLSCRERSLAPFLSLALQEAKSLYHSGECRASVFAASIKKTLSKLSGTRVDYIQVVDSENLQPLSKVGDRSATIALAVFFGKTRLIDNIQLSLK
ncbi:MAG: pantoate--beta-alanine ligase [Chthoniobacterales bacterium]